MTHMTVEQKKALVTRMITCRKRVEKISKQLEMNCENLCQQKLRRKFRCTMLLYKKLILKVKKSF